MAEILHHLGWCWNPINNGIVTTNLNWCSPDFRDPSTVGGVPKPGFSHWKITRLTSKSTCQTSALVLWPSNCSLELTKKSNPPWNEQFVPENGWLEYLFPFLLGPGLFSGANLLLVSGSVSCWGFEGRVRVFFFFFSGAFWRWRFGRFEVWNGYVPKYGPIFFG